MAEGSRPRCARGRDRTQERDTLAVRAAARQAPVRVAQVLRRPRLPVAQRSPRLCHRVGWKRLVAGRVSGWASHFLGRRTGRVSRIFSVFTMCVEHDEVDQVVAALTGLATSLSPVPAVAHEYRYNREGAPELFYARSDGFRRLQRGVVAAVEPLRRGRLRELDSGGNPLAPVLARILPRIRLGCRSCAVMALMMCLMTTMTVQPARHVVLAGRPAGACRSDGPAPGGGLHRVVERGRMSPNGTCTHRYRLFQLGGTVGAEIG
jgi:hypothetical protein